MTSFFPRIIQEWDSLPMILIELNSVATSSDLIIEKLCFSLFVLGIISFVACPFPNNDKITIMHC